MEGISSGKTRSPDSLVPSDSGQPEPEKRDDKALTCRGEGEANLRAATEVNAVTASSYPPAITPTQPGAFPGASLSLGGEACHGPECSESESGPPGRCRGRWHAKTAHQRGTHEVGPERPCSVRRRRLRPVGKRIRANPESAGPKPSRESEVAVLPMHLG